MLTLYYPTQTIIGSNVDGVERMALLSSYKDWLKSLYKNNQKAFAAKRAQMKDILLKGIVIELGPWEKEKDKSTEVSDNIGLFFREKNMLRLLFEDHGGRKQK